MIKGGIEVEVAAAIGAIEPQVVLYSQGHALMPVCEGVGNPLHDGLGWRAHSEMDLLTEETVECLSTAHRGMERTEKLF